MINGFARSGFGGSVWFELTEIPLIGLTTNEVIMENPYQPSDVTQPPVVTAAETPRPNEGDATGGIIPYKNPKALIAYYLGIFSGLPLCGPLL